MRTIQSQMITLIYQTLLAEFGRDAMLEVFCDDTFEVDYNEILGGEFFTRLVSSNSQIIRLSYLITIFERIESYCVKQQIPITTFLKKMIKVKAEAFCMSQAPDVLHFIEPLFHEVYKEPNPYLFAFKVIGVIHQKQLPGSSFKLVGHTIDGQIGRGTMQLLYDRENLQGYAYDTSLWKSFILKASPSFINLPHFNSVRTSADCRTIDTILAAVEHSFEGDLLMVEGKAVGRRMSFEQFKDTNPLYKDAFSPDGWEGVFIEEEFYSEKQLRMLLEKGCFYDAPVGLMDIEYTVQRETTQRLLTNITKTIKDLAYGVENEQYLHFLDLHKQLINSLSDKLEITYYHESKRVVINGDYFSKSLPATLLYFLCREFTERNKTTFQYSDIITDPLFYIDNKKPNLTVRIKRLSQKLAKEFPQLRITTTGRGEFEFGCDCTVDISLA